MTQFRWMKLVEHVACMECLHMSVFWPQNVKGRDHLGNLRIHIDLRIILKWMLNKYCVKVCMDSAGLGPCWLESSCEQLRTFEFYKSMEFLDQLVTVQVIPCMMEFKLLWSPSLGKQLNWLLQKRSQSGFHIPWLALHLKITDSFVN